MRSKMVGKRRWAGVVVALDCPMTSSTGFSCPIVCSQHLRPRPSSGWLGAGGGGGGMPSCVALAMWPWPGGILRPCITVQNP